MAEYVVVPADLDKDRQVIVDLWRQNLADINHLEEKYAWHFLNNPFGPGQIWILEAGGQPIGTTALGMRPLKIRETVATAGVACDLAVNKEHRFLQPALMLQRGMISSARASIRILYGVPNSRGASVMKHIGYREFCCVHRYAKVLRISHYMRKFGKVGAMVPFIGRVADQGFAALQPFIRRRKNGRVARVLPCFDERFDDLWRRLSPEHALLTVRDRRFLNWRYRECPLRQYKTLGLLTEGESRLLGYLIYYVEDNMAFCADLFASGIDESLDCLLSSWATLAWDEGLAALSVSCSGALAAILVRQGFSRRSIAPPSKPDRTRRREQCKTLFTHERPPGTEPAVADSWYYTEGDSPY